MLCLPRKLAKRLAVKEKQAESMASPLSHSMASSSWQLMYRLIRRDLHSAYDWVGRGLCRKCSSRAPTWARTAQRLYFCNVGLCVPACYSWQWSLMTSPFRRTQTHPCWKYQKIWHSRASPHCDKSAAWKRRDFGQWSICLTHERAVSWGLKGLYAAVLGLTTCPRLHPRSRCFLWPM